MMKAHCVWPAEVSGDGKNRVGIRDAALGIQGASHRDWGDAALKWGIK